MKRQTDLRVIPVGHIQDFQDDFCLVHKPIISHFLSDPLEDFGEGPLTQTLHLRCEIIIADYKAQAHKNKRQGEKVQERLRAIK